MALTIDKCPEAGWVKTNEPGFDSKGYWAIRIRRGSRVSSTDNQHTSKQSKRNRWENRYTQKNRARSNSASKWASWNRRGY